MAGGASRRNGRTALILATAAAAMAGLSFASVPLYDLFCRVTGFGGTPGLAEAAPMESGARSIAVRFNADVDPRLPWQFQPKQRQIQLRVGEPGLASYTARNIGTTAINGVATFNVTPLKAGAYFDKIQCFCFDEQRLEPGQVVDMPVSFFIDPAIMDDRNLDDVRTITLSYTFFPAPGDGAKTAARETVARPRGAADGS